MLKKKLVKKIGKLGDITEYVLEKRNLGKNMCKEIATKTHHSSVIYHSCWVQSIDQSGYLDPVTQV